MLRNPTISILYRRQNWWAVSLSLAYLLVMVYALQTYLLWQSVNMILGLVAMPIVTVFKTHQQGSLRYAIAAVLSGVLSILLPVNTLLYFTIVFAVLFIAETFIGRINILPLLLALFMSPVVQYMANVFSFPIRLQLTAWAGQMLHFAGMQATVHGNMIGYNGNEFAVDPACMGLNMIVTSLVLQLILVGISQKKYGRQASWWQVLLLLGVITLLNVVSNLFRIVILVWFNILPGTLMHDLTGIACLFLYVIVPAVFLTGRFIKWKGKPYNYAASTTNTKMRAALHLSVLALTVFAAIGIQENNEAIKNTSGSLPAVNGYKAQRYSADIVKLENEQSLVYIKGIHGFYSADHNPMICWRGSGYEFRHIVEEAVGKTTVFTALLQNGNDELYTAWWYDNGSTRTIDQLSWRWDMLTGGKNYSVVNVTATSREQLWKEIESIQLENRLSILIN